MCLLERQTPFFSPPGVWDRLQQYLSLNKQAIHPRQRRTACLSACCIFSEWGSSDREPPQATCSLHISHALLKPPIEELGHNNHDPVSKKNLYMNKCLQWLEMIRQDRATSNYVCGEVIWRAVSQQQSVQNLETQLVSQVLELSTADLLMIRVRFGIQDDDSGSISVFFNVEGMYFQY